MGYGQENDAPYGTLRAGSTPPVDFVSDSVFRWTQTTTEQNSSDPGDSGAPIFRRVNDRYQVIGVVSGGWSPSGNRGDIGSNTRVDSYLDWIRRIVDSLEATDRIDPPSLVIESESIFTEENLPLQSIEFSVSNFGDTFVKVETDQPTLFQQLYYESTDEGRGAVFFATTPNQRGTAKLIITAFAGQHSTVATVTLSVEERNDPPTVAPMDAVVVSKNSTAQNVVLKELSAGIGEEGEVLAALVGSYPEGFFREVSLFQSTGNGESEEPHVIRFSPAANVTGYGQIVFSLRDAGPDGQYFSDDDGITTESFQVLSTENQAPTLAAIASKRVAIGTSEKSFPLQGITSGEPTPQSLRIEAVNFNNSIADVIATIDLTGSIPKLK